jgi:hypothetical protein
VARACTVVAELAAQDAVPVGIEERLSQALRDELGVAPAVRLAPFRSLPRTTFKATRTVDTEGTAAPELVPGANSRGASADARESTTGWNAESSRLIPSQSRRLAPRGG